MVVIRESGNGRFEVHAEDRHWEAFDGTLGAILAAQGLAGQIAAESGEPVLIHTPWGDKQVAVPTSAQVEILTDPLELTIDPDPVFG